MNNILHERTATTESNLLANFQPEEAARIGNFLETLTPRFIEGQFEQIYEITGRIA